MSGRNYDTHVYEVGGGEGFLAIEVEIKLGNLSLDGEKRTTYCRSYRGRNPKLGKVP